MIFPRGDAAPNVRKIEGSPPFSAHAAQVSELRRRQEAWEADIRSRFAVLDAILAKAKAGSAAIAALLAENQRLRKARDAQDRVREIRRTEATLQKARALKKSAGWAKIPFGTRWDILEAERKAISHLSKLEPDERALNRESLRLKSAQHRQAMRERGVFFDRMGG